MAFPGLAITGYPPEDFLLNPKFIEDNVITLKEVARSIKDIVNRVSKMVDGSEYKRRQSAPGIKTTPKAFGKDRRMPITNRYRG